MGKGMGMGEGPHPRSHPPARAHSPGRAPAHWPRPRSRVDEWMMERGKGEAPRRAPRRGTGVEQARASFRWRWRLQGQGRGSRVRR
jgi:hypothetical protein